ncbi:hypothetical protein HPP92_007570 [Vanilla planifolia]|uniref:Uncharacterized protein n=1 Tax=Vanilla planifolia TaxID=51239 RepID=A0A835RRF8_VANPL|nr:hypothetical protein HPP92_007570 [Vanilla planifolia]
MAKLSQFEIVSCEEAAEKVIFWSVSRQGRAVIGHGLGRRWTHWRCCADGDYRPDLNGRSNAMVVQPAGAHRSWDKDCA